VRNKLLSSSTAADIESQVDKVLRGLGNPEPPLDLDQVRALLRLDRQFYSTNDGGLMAETLSRLRIATKQVIARPTLIYDAVTKWGLRALWLPDRRRILIDEATPPRKIRWTEGHEIIHGLLPWHAELMLGDDEQTLSPACHDDLEAEANYGAGQLQFLRKRFVVRAQDMPLTLDTVKSLGKDFTNTMASTLWRFVESVHPSRLLFGAITAHPHPRHRPSDFDANNPCRYFIRSPAFAERYSKVTEVEVYAAIESYCAPRKGGPLGSAEMPILDDNEEEHIFLFETFYNQYDALTLAVYQRPRQRSVQVIAPAA
jgi:hypothetical protein